MLVDSHCHLDRLDLNAALAEAKIHNIGHILCVCIDLENFPKVLAIAEQYPHISASVGVHPTEIIPTEPTTNELIKLGSHAKVVAVGETGLDYYRDDSHKQIQQERFRAHIRAAKQLNKAIIVHSRYAREDTLQILKEE